MGVNLIGNGGESANWGGWRYLLDVAYAFGWQPIGTAPPDGWEGEWKGGYSSNDGQIVTEPDARALSNALYRAIGALEAGETLNDEQAKALDPKCEGFIRSVRALVAGKHLNDEQAKAVHVADVGFFRATVALATGEMLDDEQAKAAHASNDDFYRAIRALVAGEPLDDEQAKALRGAQGAHDNFLLRFAQYFARGAFAIG